VHLQCNTPLTCSSKYGPFNNLNVPLCGLESKWNYNFSPHLQLSLSIYICTVGCRRSNLHSIRFEKNKKILYGNGLEAFFHSHEHK